MSAVSCPPTLISAGVTLWIPSRVLSRFVSASFAASNPCRAFLLLQGFSLASLLKITCYVATQSKGERVWRRASGEAKSKTVLPTFISNVGTIFFFVVSAGVFHQSGPPTPAVHEGNSVCCLLPFFFYFLWTNDKADVGLDHFVMDVTTLLRRVNTRILYMCIMSNRIPAYWLQSWELLRHMHIRYIVMDFRRFLEMYAEADS